MQLKDKKTLIISLLIAICLSEYSYSSPLSRGFMHKWFVSDFSKNNNSI